MCIWIIIFVVVPNKLINCKLQLQIEATNETCNRNFDEDDTSSCEILNFSKKDKLSVSNNFYSHII